MDLGNHTEGTEGQVTFLRLCCWEKRDNFTPLPRFRFHALSMKFSNSFNHYAQNWLRYDSNISCKIVNKATGVMSYG